MTEGDVIAVTCGGQTVEGVVVLASPNGKSLMLTFDAILDTCMGMMPVLQRDDGSYINVATGNPVEVQFASGKH